MIPRASRPHLDSLVGALLLIASAVGLAWDRSQSDLDEVLRRAGEAVVRQARESTVLLGDERCMQRIFSELPPDVGAGNLPLGGGSVCTAQRQWKAELALVLIEGAEQIEPLIPWVEIRDVIEVDGKRLPDRDARLDRLSMIGQGWTRARAAEIVEENARFNIGPVHRTVNAPTIPLLVLHPANQGRFTFSRAGEKRVGDVMARQVGFQEEQHPTLIRAVDDGADMPAAGTLWIDPGTGEVVRAELRCGAQSETRLTVTYRWHPKFGLTLPVQMVEKTMGNGVERVEGTCNYANFRRFETSGRILPPKAPDAADKAR